MKLDPPDPDTGPGPSVEGLLTVEDVCAWLSVSRHWVYDEVEARRLPHVRLGRRSLRFHRPDIQAYLKARTRDAMRDEPSPVMELWAGGLEPLD